MVVKSHVYVVIDTLLILVVLTSPVWGGGERSAYSRLLDYEIENNKEPTAPAALFCI